MGFNMQPPPPWGDPSEMVPIGAPNQGMLAGIVGWNALQDAYNGQCTWAAFDMLDTETAATIT